MKKYPIHVTKHKIHNTSFEEVKNILWKTICNCNYAQKYSKWLQSKMIESTYNVNTHYNLFYALKVYIELFELYTKDKTDFSFAIVPFYSGQMSKKCW